MFVTAAYSLSDHVDMEPPLKEAGLLSFLGFFLWPCITYSFETYGRCVLPTGPGHPAGELHLQQEILGLSG